MHTYREEYRKALFGYLNPRKDELCNDCKRKLDSNILRILDCKNPNCKEISINAPSILDHLSKESKSHFERVQNILKMVSIPYEINHRIVRGLDYYTETVFELTSDELGAQNAVAAGGRYNNLVEKFDGPITPAVGFAIGVERVILLHQTIYKDGFIKKTDIYIAWIGDNQFSEGFKMAIELRRKGISVEIDHDGKSLKSQLKRANKLHAKYTLIIGEEKFQKGLIKIRNMNESSEEEISIKDINKLSNILN